MKFEQPEPIERRESKSEPLSVMKINVDYKPNPFSLAVSQVMRTLGRTSFKSENQLNPDDRPEVTNLDNVMNELNRIKEVDPASVPDVLMIIVDSNFDENVKKRIRLFIRELRNNFPEEIGDDYYPYVLVITPATVRARSSDISEANFVLAGTNEFITRLLFQLHSIPDLMEAVIDEKSDDRETESKIKKQDEEKRRRGISEFYNFYKEKIKERSNITADTEREVERLKDIFKQNNVKTVLDAGGGEGRIAKPLTDASYSVTGVDLSPELVKIAVKKGLNFVVGDLKHMPIKDESQDAVTFNWHVFCDIDGPSAKMKVLSEANRVLNSGGMIVLDIPDRAKLPYDKNGIYYHAPGGESEPVYIGYVPRKEEMKAFLEKSGFTDIQVESWSVKQGDSPEEEGYPKLTFVAKKK